MDEYFTIQNNMKCCKLCGNHSQFALGKPKLWMDHLTDTHKIENLEEFKLPTTSVVKPLSISEATVKNEPNERFDIKPITKAIHYDKQPTKRKISEIIIIDSESDSDEEHTDDGVSKAAANYSLLDHIDGSDELLSDETIADGVKRKSLTSVKPKYQEYDVNLNEARGTRHKEGRYKCGHCPKSFRSVPMLIEHYLSIHENKTFKCFECEWSSTPVRYNSAGNLRRHLKSQHPNYDYIYVEDHIRRQRDELQYHTSETYYAALRLPMPKQRRLAN